MQATISVVEIKRRRSKGLYIGWAANRYLELLARGDLDICAYCKVGLDDSNRTIDHIIPKALGGSNRLSNLCLCCIKCNNLKGDSPVSEFMQRREQPHYDDTDRNKPVPKKKRKLRCPIKCPCECHEPLLGNPHRGKPCPGKFQRYDEDWDLQIAKERRAGGLAFHRAEQARRAERRRGLPDP